ncbi:creatininase family protein [Synechococcus sp. CCY9201]|jgi:creatinine amidohydrolase|uniref:creatininase family protein n=1 Tax=unclassified Synechococcus TaxID=2626047 RepID=UPI0018CCE2D3|nr:MULTISPECIES: creatininase family protein [unclassified Synechococcus]MEA5424107.1 creatininase family protein [Synechococcus sp. CCY9202]MEA5475610.1 creatininase family protein [Synechococcus sp. CCY9201]QPN59980.1 creatininase family protein [Synechococcus sp. CBW1002]CAK6692097.1 Putative mycofactocin system creatinine amidohydrolase family protein MftE [Synechococcus sp. CBW1107]
MERRLERLSWPALQAAASRPGSTVVWPFGAIEQHGPHLPLGTDALFAEKVLEAVLEGWARQGPDEPAWPLWRLPVQAIGFSPEHQGFAGTLSLDAETLIAMVQAVGRDLAAAGFRRLVLFNGHGGQIALLQVAARQLRAAHPALAVLPCFLWSGPEGIADLIPEPERSQGLHAALAETSLMLHLAPSLVGPLPPADGLPSQAPPTGWSLEGAAPSAWLSRDLSRSGVIGDPGEASGELGQELFERLVAGWRSRFEALLASDWPPGSPGGDYSPGQHP